MILLKPLLIETYSKRELIHIIHIGKTSDSNQAVQFARRYFEHTTDTILIYLRSLLASNLIYVTLLVMFQNY